MTVPLWLVAASLGLFVGNLSWAYLRPLDRYRAFGNAGETESTTVPVTVSRARIRESESDSRTTAEARRELLERAEQRKTRKPSGTVAAVLTSECRLDDKACESAYRWHSQGVSWELIAEKLGLTGTHAARNAHLGASTYARSRGLLTPRFVVGKAPADPEGPAKASADPCTHTTLPLGDETSRMYGYCLVCDVYVHLETREKLPLKRRP